jgi:hypothetical protein
MKTLDNKLIIYDSNCKVCSSLKEVVLQFTSIPEKKIKAYQDLPAEMTHLVDAGEFKNGMALISTSGETTVYGPEGVAYIFSSQYKVLDKLLNIPAVFNLFGFLYKTQAYNRYIMAIPKSRFHCDCFPDKVVRYRISYILMAAFISVVLTALLGVSLRNFFSRVTAFEAAGQMLLIAGSGWVIQMLIIILCLKEKALDYIGHLASIMVAGLLVLVPWMVFYFLSRIAIPHIPAISVVFSSACMLYLHIYRTRFLEMSQWWTVSWFLLLQGTAFFWIYIFYLK